MLDRYGHHAIFNEKEGEWNDDVWFSNKSYLYKKYSYQHNNDYELYSGDGDNDYTPTHKTSDDHATKNKSWMQKIEEITANIDVDFIDQKLAEASRL
jgi:hypothetical protein